MTTDKAASKAIEQNEATQALVKSFAFVAPTAIPKREASATDRLSAFRTEQAAARRAAGEAAAKGLLAGKALTDNVIYDEQIGAVRVSSRAKALVAPVLAESNQRASVTVSGSGNAWRWYLVAKVIPADEV